MSQGVFAPGARVIVRDEEWLVRSTNLVTSGGSAVRVIGVSELVRNQERIFLTDLDDINEMRLEDTKLVPDDSPQYRRSRLYIESLLRRTPPTDDKIYLGHEGALDPALYQLVPAHRALSALRPAIGIFDGVGIGKTLEVGIILSELIKRGRGERILVVALKSILAQFQQELWTRFSIPLVRLDTEGLQRVRSKIPSNKNPFYYFNRCIISIDTLKNDGRYRTFLEECRWDAIVIDECHHVANADAQRGRLATLLANTTDSLILTSATPHNGKPEGFANLMNMLEPTAVANPQRYSKDDIKGLFVRRFKKDVADEVGQHFRDRKTEARVVSASDKETKLLVKIKSLRFHTLNRKTTSKGKDILFSTTLIKAFLSSPQACLETVTNRLASIKTRLEDPKNGPNTPLHKDLQSDSTILEMLTELLENLIEKPTTKMVALGDYLQSIGWNGKSDLRVIVFSERIRTLEVIHEYLTDRFNLKEKAVNLFHAGLPDTDQMQIVEDFGKSDTPVRLLLASDVASEGVNLHFHCHHLVHFDVPYSLITLEQRNGRIDRYGQEKTPHCVSLITKSDAPEVRDDLSLIILLIQKEGMVNRNVGDAATLLKVYDPRKEEEIIEAGLSAGTPPEQILQSHDTHEEQDFLDLLQQCDPAPVPQDYKGKTYSLYLKENRIDDLAFVRAAFDELKATDKDFSMPDFHPTIPSLTFTAPDDLWSRCQFIPREAQPDNRYFQLTTDRDRVKKAIADARRRTKEGENSWPREQLLWELHPVMQWLLDKVMCRFQRHEAPVIVDPRIGKDKGYFLMQGILSNKRSQPVVAEWFAIQTDSVAGLSIRILTLQEMLDSTYFDEGIPNAGKPSHLMNQLQDRLKAVIPMALAHMTKLARKRSDALKRRVEEDQERFERWYEQGLGQIDADRTKYQASYSGGIPRNLRERLSFRKHLIEERKTQRTQWLNETFQVGDNPYLRLAAVFVGE